MGLIARLFAVSDETLSRIKDEHPLVGHVIDPTDPFRFYEIANEPVHDGVVLKISGSQEMRFIDTRPALPLQTPEGHGLNLDKSWHGLHFCLTGCVGKADHVLSFLRSGGLVICDDYPGLGRPRLFMAKETETICDEVAVFAVEALRKNYNADAMEHVYPNAIASEKFDDMADDFFESFWRDERCRAFEYLERHFVKLQEFLKLCKAHKLGFVINLDSRVVAEEI